MKIKVQSLGYDQVIALPRPPRIPPRRPHRALRTLLKLASAPELRRVRFQWRSVGMDRLAQDEPCLILMNHSSFIDLKIAATVLYPRPFHIVCTSDGFIGKAGLMRALGCIPTNKFVTDTALVRFRFPGGHSFVSRNRGVPIRLGTHFAAAHRAAA